MTTDYGPCDDCGKPSNLNQQFICGSCYAKKQGKQENGKTIPRGMHCAHCGNTADAYPKRLDIVAHEFSSVGKIKVTILCRQCGHFSQWLELPKAVNF